MSKRAKILELIRIAGYEGDNKTFLRLYVDNRISYKAAREAWVKGEKQRKA